MTRLNFKNFSMPSGVCRKEMLAVDARESFADLMYRNVNGIRAHALAMKIYKSDGAEEYTADEIKLMEGVAERFCTPAFIDGFRAQIRKSGMEAIQE